MDTKKLISNLRKEANTALSRVFDKVEEVSKSSSLKIKIHNLETKIKNTKTKIGEHIVANKEKFMNDEVIKAFISEIEAIEEEITAKQELLQNIKETEEEETSQTTTKEETDKDKKADTE